VSSDGPQWRQGGEPRRVPAPLPGPGPQDLGAVGLKKYLYASNSSKGPHKATHGQGEATSQHCHRGQQTLSPEVTQSWGAERSRRCRAKRGFVGVKSKQRSSQSHTRARRSHIPALPQRAANTESRSNAVLGVGCAI